MYIKNILSSLQKHKVYAFASLAILVLAWGVFCLIKTDSKITLAGEQVNLLINQVRNFYKNKPNAWGLNTYSSIKNHIIPSNMLNGRQIRNSLNKDVLLGADMLGNTVMPGSPTFAIVYKNLNYDECVELATYPFSEKTMLSIDSVSVINDTTLLFSWGSANSLPINKQNAQKACKENNDLLWNIYL